MKLTVAFGDRSLLPPRWAAQGESVKIAYLGWGSLVWNPEALPIQGAWFADGPLLPVEYARQSKDDRLTLVILPEQTAVVRSLWALCPLATPQEARRALQVREGIPDKNLEPHVALWSGEEPEDPVRREIAQWAKALRLNAVLWTNLPPKFGQEERAPREDEAVEYLRTLRPLEARRNAERYVRMTPRQIETPFRRRFELELGWTPLGAI